MRHDWTFEEVKRIYEQPLLDLVFKAATVHRENFSANEVQVGQLISVKTGSCPEDCKYCPQAARYTTDIKKHALMNVEQVLTIAKKAKANGVTRLCLGAAWREVKDNSQFERVLEMVEAVNAEGLEVCATLGLLEEHQAFKLKEAGLHAYNHNLDTSAEHYSNIISTRTYEDRLRTIANVRKAKITVCCGGILGMGESAEDRIKLLLTLANLPQHPESVPINTLVKVKGTPLGDQDEQQVPIWDLLRMIATARILMPSSYVRMSAGRIGRSYQDQALCFLAGANSIFAGDKLLTTPNNSLNDDETMFSLLGIKPQERSFQYHADTDPVHAG
jgi:biotin synthase